MEFREARQQSLTEMEELRKFQSSSFDTIARRKLIEDENTILELSGRVVLSFSDSRILNLTILPRCHQMGFLSLIIKFRPTLNRIPEYHHFVD